MIDEIDRQLLALLQADGKVTNAELGTRVGLSLSAVNERVRKLKASGVIRAYRADIDPLAVDLPLCAFVRVGLSGPGDDNAFLSGILALPEVLECHHVTGDDNYFLKLRSASPAALERLLSEDIKALPGVVRTHTVIALSSPKETPALPLGVTPA